MATQTKRATIYFDPNLHKAIRLKAVEKNFRVKSKKDLKKSGRIEALAEDSRPPRCEKLTGQDRYRLRQGRYRILYSIQDDELTVWFVKVGHRKEIYR